MAFQRKASDGDLMSAYERLENVWEVAALFGMCGQSVHERLTKLGVINRMRVFSQAEKERLAKEYVPHRNAGNLQALADSMGRTKQFLCRQARALGLTDIQKSYSPQRTTIDAMGYVSHRGKGPNCSKHEHRLVAGASIGRTIAPDEVVHHIDGDRLNNSPGNLEVMTRAQHSALHSRAMWDSKRASQGEDVT